MRIYNTHEEFFRDFKAVTRKIEQNGIPEAAQILRDGFSCLNSLTDGWAMLMDSIEKVISEFCGSLSSDDMKELNELLEVVKFAVFRR